MRHSRVAAATCFGVAAFLTAAGMYLVPALRRGGVSVVLFIAWPTVSGAVAGFLVGHRVASAARLSTALAWSAAVVVTAFAICAVLFGSTYGWISGEPSNPFMLAVGVFTIGGVIAGPPACLAAFAAAALLYRAARSSVDASATEHP